MILVVDNRDSFLFNLVQLLLELGASVEVRRSAELDVERALALAPERVLIGPGPGRPAGAGCSEALVRALAGRVPVLGVCLGHQAIGTAFGGRVRRSRALLHGRPCRVEHDGRGVFADVASPASMTLYNSLVLEESSLPGCLEVSARSDDGEVMGVRHRELALEGVQFHPESIQSRGGDRILRNFLEA